MKVNPDALDLRFDSDAGEHLSIREYLHCLLIGLWTEGEGFSGKRPFGNSGWEFDLYAPLIKAGFIDGELDDYGYVDQLGRGAHDYVKGLIDLALLGKICEQSASHSETAHDD